MIRPLTFFCVVLAGTSGLYLYTEKHQTTVLDQQISRVVLETQQIRERTSMLRAEWALLNQPDRLQSLATRFLPQLHPLDPTQFVQLASVEQRLPELIQPDAPAPAQPAEITPEQVMARATLPSELATLSDTPHTPDVQIADGADQPADTQAAPEPARHVAAVAQPRRAPVRPHAPRPVLLASTQPARPVEYKAVHPGRTAPLVQMAAYSALPLRRLIPNASMTHPAPLPIAAWRPAQRYVSAQDSRYQSPRYQVAGFGGSSLGFSHVALPPPVPMQDGN
nr:ABC transporter permease [uncultured Lichenicoccus sp.]